MFEEKRFWKYDCGEGWTTAETAALDGVIDSFDISPVAIEHAQRFLTKRYRWMYIDEEI